MNRKLIIPVALVALAAAIAFVKIQGADDSSPDAAAAASGSKATKRDAGFRREEAAAPGFKTTRREMARNDELVEKYGSVRTKLARKISADVVSLLDDALGLGEQMARFGGGRSQARIARALRGSGIKLDEEQRQQVAQLYETFQDQQIARARSAVQAVRKDPTALMELLLAGDAKERGILGQEEFTTVQTRVGQELMGVINPLDRENLRGGRPFDDPAFREDFLAILDPEQKAAFEARQAEQSAGRADDTNSPNDASSEQISAGNISNMPTMKLETLDEAVISATQVASGIKQMVEGFGNLRSLQPQLEGNRGDGSE
jgi:Spy/CpxP family protein refolding chaperone